MKHSKYLKNEFHEIVVRDYVSNKFKNSPWYKELHRNSNPLLYQKTLDQHVRINVQLLNYEVYDFDLHFHGDLGTVRHIERIN